jgi:hypothetical protein
MKQFAKSLFFVGLALCGACQVRASEAAPDSETAVETLRIGIATHPDQAVVLFQDSLQTNPECRRELLVAALGILGGDPAYLTRLLYVARLEFPEDDSLFAEAALSVVPDLPAEIRASFAASTGQMQAVLGGAPVEPFLPPVEPAVAPAPETSPASRRVPSEESRRLDEAIREAMSRVAAKTSGRIWPEQSLASDPIRFRKPDEVRISRQSRVADESSLFNHLPLDRSDEREIAPGGVKIDDRSKPAASIRRDESKFARRDREASTAPLDAKLEERSPAGSVALPRRPPLPRSSVYFIPAAAGGYESTIDQAQGGTAPPALIIRPEAASPTAPRRPS